MNILFLLLSIVPAIEARGAAFYFICAGSEYLAFILLAAVMLNFAAVIVFLKLLDRAMIPGRIERFLDNRVNKRIKRIESWFKRYGNLAIFLLIALPSTGIGSFTGAFIGRVFELRGKIFYLSVLAGIALSLVPAVLIAYGINILGVCSV